MPTIRFTNATGSFSYEENTTPPPIDPPPIDPPPTTPPPEGGGDFTPPDYVRTDTRAENVPNTPKPGYLEPHTDPTFKTKIIRITGDPGTAIRNITGAKWGNECRHHYNSDQAWNCNQTLLYLDINQGTGNAGTERGLILDGESYEPRFTCKNTPGDCDVRWHATDPALMIYAAGNKLGTWNPKSGANLLIRNFGSGYSGMYFGPWEGSPSESGELVVLTCSGGIAFAYDIATDKKYPDLNVADVGGRGEWTARISSSGKYIVWNIAVDKVVVTDLNGTAVTTLAENFISHFDVCIDGDDEDCVVGRNNGGAPGVAGALTKYRLRDGKRTQLCPGGWCSHSSSRSKTHKYAVSGPTDEAGGVPPPYKGEIILSALDGSKTWRLGHTHENPQGYDYIAQTQPSHSPDGGRVIFASAWGESGVSCFVIDIRS